MGCAAGTAFRETAFRRLPLACLMIGAGVAAGCGRSWTEGFAPVPWIISLGLVGLPHGAADLAASRRAWRGWPLTALWLAYVGAMLAVGAGFAVAPRAMIAVFAVVSCWHFGVAHLDAEESPHAFRPRWVAALSRGCAVLAAPLAVFPDATSDVAADLASLALGHGTAADLFPPDRVQSAGLVLAVVALSGAIVEVVAARTRSAGLRLLVELVVIASLGCLADPLFSVGLYFLVWHGWRQMLPLAESLTGRAPGTWRELGSALLRIHAAALPLLIPTWGAIAALWWWSAGSTSRDLAVISIAAYMIVTPAHELLGELLRVTQAPWPAAGGLPRA